MGGASFLASIRSRLTYANVMATLALFVALGGGAYATTSLVGGDGVIHACAAGNGSLSLIRPGKRCPKGKSAIAWNQGGVQGRPGPAGGPGAPGAKGDQGLRGERGPQGPGAVSFNVHEPNGFDGILATVGAEGVTGVCEKEPAGHIDITLTPVDPEAITSVSGDEASDGKLESLQEAGRGSRPDLEATKTANLDVIGTDNGTWSRFDIGASKGGVGEGCNFWGLITPGG